MENLLRPYLEQVRICPSPTRHRTKLVYSLPLELAVQESQLAVQEIDDVARCVNDWALHSSCMPASFYREVMVRQSRLGSFQIKLLLQIAMEADANIADDSDQLERHIITALPGWIGEREAFLAHMKLALARIHSAASRTPEPEMGDGISFQLATGPAHPPKTAPCAPLSGPLRLLEDIRGYTFLVQPETMSQVNHTTADALVGKVAGWPGLEQRCHCTGSLDDTSAAAAAAAASAVLAGSSSVLITGRDVNLFGAALFHSTDHGLHIVTHCSNAYADLGYNFSHLRECSSSESRQTVKGDRSTEHSQREYGPSNGRRVCTCCIPKGKPTASHLRRLVLPEESRRLRAPPEVAVVTAGRRGIGRDVCLALRDDLPLRALIYVSCCDATLLADLAILTAQSSQTLGCLVVADAERYDHFPRSGHTGAALLLLRAPGPILALPIGPAGTGKTTLCANLRAALLPIRKSVIIERDVVYASQRAQGAGIGLAKRQTHSACVELLQSAALAGQVVLFDSCNASEGGRAHYERIAKPACTLLISFEPVESNGSPKARQATSEQFDDYVRLLRQRAASRQSHPTFPQPSEPELQTAAIDATIAAMEWPSEAEVVRSEDEAICRRVLIRCDPWSTPAVTRERIIPHILQPLLWMVGASNVPVGYWLPALQQQRSFLPAGNDDGSSTARMRRAVRASDEVGVVVVQLFPSVSAEGNDAVRLVIARF